MENTMMRQQSLEAVSTDLLDVLVIGGGIVGSGIARDAAMRGLRVGLVEQDDFASGTSSRSSRLLHGGLRYLAQGRLRLVREASVEKRVIHEIAPHLAEPLPFLFPTRGGDKDWPLWKLKVGVKLYDALCGWRNLGKSQWLSAAETASRLPQLERDGLNGAVRYFDGLTNDARLVYDTLRSAHRHGALLCSRTKLQQARLEAGQWHSSLVDRVTARLYDVRSRWIVNAAGPWGSSFPQSGIQLRLTKGVHLVIDRAKLPVPDAVVLTEGRRILFVIPWGERLIIGTTDTDYSGDPRAVRCDDADVAYLLQIVNARFPRAGLSEADVMSAWAGLRPLVAPRGGHPSDASRSHEIRVGRSNWMDVAGGKLTTYRLIAEQAVDQLVRRLPGKAGDCRTAKEPLLQSGEATGVSSIVPPEVTRRAVEHYCREEWALTLEDIMVRRSSWHYYCRNALEVAVQVAGWMGEINNWDQRRVQLEIEEYALATQRRGSMATNA